MNIIGESHIHPGIPTAWLESIPASEEFKITVHESESEGLDHCIDTNESSEIYWERRGNRSNLSRMVVGTPVVTNKIVTIECPNDDGVTIVLATAYYGREVADREPFQHNWSEEDCNEWVRNNPDHFWSTHALVKEA